MAFYSEYFLNIPTSRFVKKIWVLDNSQNEKGIPSMNILPNGCFNIAIVIGEGALVKIKDIFFNVNQNIYFCSQVTESVTLAVKPKTKVLFIQLYAWAFSFDSTINFNNFKDTIVESYHPFQFLNTQINYTSSSILEDIILITENHFKNKPVKNPIALMIEEICKKIESKKGICKLSNIYNDYNYSPKWIQRSFKKATGLTPKKFSEIIQFRFSVDAITHNKTNKKLTNITYKSGYSDQSHFIKSFRQFSSKTPSKFNPNNFILSLKS